MSMNIQYEYEYSILGTCLKCCAELETEEFLEELRTGRLYVKEKNAPTLCLKVCIVCTSTFCRDYSSLSNDSDHQDRCPLGQA